MRLFLIIFNHCDLSSTWTVFPIGKSIEVWKIFLVFISLQLFFYISLLSTWFFFLHLCSFDLDKFQIEFWIHMIEKFSLGGFVHTLASETQRQSLAHERRLELLTLCGLRHLKSDPPITSDGSDMERCFFCCCCCCCFKRWCSNPHSTMITIPPRILWLTAITTAKIQRKGCVNFDMKNDDFKMCFIIMW